jgi:abortive infection bacteriophage resistance protein
MKLVINRKLVFDKAETKEEILKEYSVYHKTMQDFIIIEPQKVVLDEFDMNVLFDEVIWNTPISVTPLGGKGCDFCLTID